MTGLLEAESVTMHYRSGAGFLRKGQTVHAVNGISLSVTKGEVLALVGESGCGKSTLAKMLLGIEQPTSGRILLDGQLLADYPRRELARRIQPIFQDPYASLNPRCSMLELIALPLLVRGEMRGRDARAQAREMMDLVGLPRRLQHTFPSQLSGGQRQRVAIARALVSRPDIVICDEPTSALDVSVQAQILNLLQERKEAMGLTYVFISHDLGTVQHFADRVAVMYLGRVVEHGPSASVLREPRHPYAQKLKAAVLPPDPAHRLPPLRFDGGFPDPTAPPPGCHFHPRCPEAMPECKEESPALRTVGDSTVACHLYPGAGASARKLKEA